MAQENIKSVRDAFLKALVATLGAVETHAERDNQKDAELTLHYAQAVNALIGSELGRELVVGKEGLKLK